MNDQEFQLHVIDKLARIETTGNQTAEKLETLSGVVEVHKDFISGYKGEKTAERRMRYVFLGVWSSVVGLAEFLFHRGH